VDRAVLVGRGVRGELHAPIRIRQRFQVAVGVIVARAMLAVDVMHEDVRIRIVRRHRRMVGIRRVEVPAARIVFQAETGEPPPAGQILLIENRRHFAIGLPVVVHAGAAESC
jgi:hypothetical protein